MLLKILKKVAGIFGFKLIDKNFVKNNRLLTGDSLISMKALLRNLFENNKINRLLQIGANDGKRFDEINFFIKKFPKSSLPSVTIKFTKQIEREILLMIKSIMQQTYPHWIFQLPKVL